MSREESCFVYMQLPLSTEPVVCGRFVREQLASGDYLGRFVYGRRYRSNPMAVPIDPVHLPLSGETYRRWCLPECSGRSATRHQMRGVDELWSTP